MVPSIKRFTSGIWQLNSVLIADKDSCLVVDPGYFPAEIHAISQYLTFQQLKPSLLLTHGHWDHIAGIPSFPHADVWVSPWLKEAIKCNSLEAQKNLTDALNFDARWYVQREKPLSWPDKLFDPKEGEEIQIGTFTGIALLLPGHTQDGLGLYLPDLQTLIAGDYLSPCEIPFVEDLNEYHNTLTKFLLLLPKVTTVIPGHGPLLNRTQAQTMIEEDLHYLDRLAKLVQTKDALAAETMPLPRAEHVPGMREFHLENWRNVSKTSI